jgi:cbb3-type cytochrome c oxidase subunit III
MLKSVLIEQLAAVRRASVRAFVVKALFVGLLLVPVAGLGMAAAQGNPEAAKIQNPVQPSPESIAAGKQAFTRYCANCHGLNAEGGPGNDLTPPAPDLTDKEWKHGSTDGEIFNTIKNGVPPELNMGAWGDQLKDQDIWNVVNYIRSMAKK